MASSHPPSPSGRKRWFFALALLALLALLGGCGAHSAPTGKAVCTCFLNAHPCVSSQHLEAWTRESLQEAFSAEMQSGRLAYGTANYDDPAQKHFMDDYHLPFQSVVLQDRGNPKRWVRLDKLWQMIGDEGKFRAYVQDMTRRFLGGEDLKKEMSN